MTRATIALLTVLGVGLAAPAAHAAAAPAAGCRLPGYVTTARTPPCPAVTSPTGPSTDSLLHPIAGVFGDVAKGVLTQIVAWADHGAADALRLTASLVGATTRPAVSSTWFSAAYWRVAALSALLTIPFLFAACAHALVRTDLALLGRAAFGYLPLAMLAVAVAAPLTSLLLSATDEMCGFVSSVSANADTDFLGRSAAALSGASLVSVDPFLVFFAAVITVAATISLWLELLVRAAAVEVIVLMLPIFFAAMVWPARRIWAIRAIETLVALILSKFAIVAVLTLGGAAITHASSGPSALLTGATIVLLAVFSPWALLRLLPLHEVAAAAAGALSHAPRDAVREARQRARGGGGQAVADGDSAVGSAPHQLVEDAALHRLAAGAGDLRHGRTGASDLDDLALAPATQEGLRAVSGAGGPRSASPGSTPPGAAASDPPTERLDGRPPLEPPFDGRPWPGFVIGDADGERMQPPALDPPSPEPPVDPPPAADPPSPPDPPMTDPPPPLDPPTLPAEDGES